MKLLVLYEELAGYFLACISRFAQKYGIEVHIIRSRVNKEAPFVFNDTGLRLYNRDEYDHGSLVKLALDLDPDAVFCAGWSNKSYLEIAKKLKPKVPVFIGFDNKWDGSLKQRLASFISPFYFKRFFSGCFVPGQKQAEFARKLGYSEDRIFKGAYSADLELFHSQYLRNRDEKKIAFPHRFIYTGRYVEHKGIKEMWEVFMELKEEMSNDWELWCLGTGNVTPVSHPDIRHFGFVQPGEMSEYIRQTGVFVLPSLFEPWGVSVHEFAAAGFPLLCSDEVGAAEQFLRDGYNGYVHKAGDKEALKRTMRLVMTSTDEELFSMGGRSAEISKVITPDKWSDTLMSMINYLKKQE